MLEIGKVYRLSKKEKNPNVLEVDGLPNFFHETAIPHAGTQFEVQRGIHVFAKVKGPDGKVRVPMIFITSSPYKAGSEDTPWKDKFDPDHGRIIYYGDNKSSEKEPEKIAGNKALLKLLEVYQNNNSKIRAIEGVPLLYFERVTIDGRPKGNLRFHGFGIALAADLVTQFKQDKATGKKDYFSNYKFNLSIFSLKNEHDKFDFIKWIGARYNTSLTTEETNQYAPQSWLDWINAGTGRPKRVQHCVPTKKIVRYSDQLPDSGSNEYKLLTEIFEQYTTSLKIRSFQKLAIEITKKVIEENGVACASGWLLKNSEKFENDFVIKMEIGDDSLTGIQIPVIAHANCVRPTQVVNNTDIAHVYDLLMVGNVSAFVTTSFFSENVQTEIYNSGKPIILINGKRIAHIVKEELFDKKLSVDEYLDYLEDRYQYEYKDPKEIPDMRFSFIY